MAAEELLIAEYALMLIPIVHLEAVFVMTAGRIATGMGHVNVQVGALGHHVVLPRQVLISKFALIISMRLILMALLLAAPLIGHQFSPSMLM